VVLSLTLVVIVLGHVNIINRVLFSHSPLLSLLMVGEMTFNRKPGITIDGINLTAGDDWGWNKKFVLAWGILYTFAGGLMWFSYLPFV